MEEWSKISFEVNRKSRISYSKSKIQNSDKFIFNNNNKENDEENITTSLKKNEKVIKKRSKSTDELFDEEIIIEMHSKSEC